MRRMEGESTLGLREELEVGRRLCGGGGRRAEDCMMLLSARKEAIGLQVDLHFILI